MSLAVKGLRETRAYLHRIHRNLPTVQQQAIGGADALNLMQSLAQADVMNIVYDVYAPEEYKRTFAIADNVRAEVVNKDPYQSAVFIPLNFNTESTAGTEAGQITYARFMLPGWANASFINGAAARATLPRDFLAEWEKTFLDVMPRKVLEAIDREIGQ